MTVPDVVIDFFRQMKQEPWFDGIPVHAFTVDSMGNNMLDYAITNGNAEVVKYLLEIGVDVNGAGEFGNTPLMTATSFGKYDLACYLLSAGGDGNKRNDDGLSAFDMLKMNIFRKQDCI